MITLDTRIADAELSVRTIAALTKAYGPDVTFRYFAEGGAGYGLPLLCLGQRGLKEFKAALTVAEQGSQREHHNQVIASAMAQRQAEKAASTKTLRDEFAMAALIGMMSERKMSMGLTPLDVAKAAYVYAESMMKARGE